MRQIFLDGRLHPKDPTPTWMGYSVGKWEGDTLVVETTGFNDRTWLDLGGHPHSDALHVTERFRRTRFGKMQLTITYTDTKVYTKPFTVTLPVLYQADTRSDRNRVPGEREGSAELIGRIKDERVSEKKVARAALAGYVGTYVGPLGTWQVVLDGDDLKIKMSADGGGCRWSRCRTRSSFQTLGGQVRFVPDGKGAAQMIPTVVEGDFRGCGSRRSEEERGREEGDHHEREGDLDRGGDRQADSGRDAGAPGLAQVFRRRELADHRADERPGDQAGQPEEETAERPERRAHHRAAARPQRLRASSPPTRTRCRSSQRPRWR